jgi:hypothetical protein
MMQSIIAHNCPTTYRPPSALQSSNWPAASCAEYKRNALSGPKYRGSRTRCLAGILLVALVVFLIPCDVLETKSSVPTAGLTTIPLTPRAMPFTTQYRHACERQSLAVHNNRSVLPLYLQKSTGSFIDGARDWIGNDTRDAMEHAFTEIAHSIRKSLCSLALCFAR